MERQWPVEIGPAHEQFLMLRFVEDPVHALTPLARWAVIRLHSATWRGGRQQSRHTISCRGANTSHFAG